MDTHKIDKKMRAFVMAPIFGFLAFLVLFPVFVSIDAGSVSMDFGVLTVGIKKIKGVITLSAIKSNPLIRKSSRLGEGLANSANADFQDA